MINAQCKYMGRITYFERQKMIAKKAQQSNKKKIEPQIDDIIKNIHENCGPDCDCLSEVKILPS